MTIYKPGDRRAYRYDFEFEGQRYAGSTKQIRKDDAAMVESALKRRLREQVGGIPARVGSTPRFQEWAEVYLDHATRTLVRPERARELLSVVLRFWGAKPTNPAEVHAGEPYRDLRLEDPIRQPELIEAFERWMRARARCGPQTRNHLRGILSRMYRVALLPAFRRASGVNLNPFVGVPRDVTVGRTVTLSPAQIRAWCEAAPAHTRLAIAIAALAPKLRLQSILSLQFSKHFDPKLQFLTMVRHKTATDTGAAQVVPVSPQLRAILKWVQKQSSSDWVITYRGEPVTHIRTGLQAAATAAGVTYGRDVEDGATFHTIRHAMATMLAELGESEAVRKAVMGHARDETTAKYTHLRPVGQAPAHARLARRLQLKAVIVGGGKSGGGRSGSSPRRTGTDGT